MAKSSLQGHEAAMSQFISIPWCADIVRKPGTVVFVPTSRFPADSQGKSPTQNQLFRDTLNNTDTVPHIIGLYQNPLSFEIGPNATPIFSSASNAGNAQTLMIKSCSLMFDIRSGINGYNGTAHGGFITSVIDEAMGSLLFVNYSLQREVEARGLPKGVFDLDGVQLFTASMAVQFQKPIVTPQVIVVTATVRVIEGRKTSMDVIVKGEGGVEFAKCDGLWLSLPRGNL